MPCAVDRSLVTLAREGDYHIFLRPNKHFLSKNSLSFVKCPARIKRHEQYKRYNSIEKYLAFTI